MSEHAVIVDFESASTERSPLSDLDDELDAAIEAAAAGQHDGHEIAVDGTNGTDGTPYAGGPDADAPLATMRPVLVAADVPHGVVATLRQGPPGDGIRGHVVRLRGAHA